MRMVTGLTPSRAAVCSIEFSPLSSVGIFRDESPCVILDGALTAAIRYVYIAEIDQAQQAFEEK
jgi:hypothetical protein